jgi:NTP pyrophosphatase (non-canonical NTP hydrolase)
MGEELVDITIFPLGLAEMTGIDLQQEIETKLAANQERVYRRLPDGVLAKAKIPGPPLPQPSQ